MGELTLLDDEKAWLQNWAKKWRDHPKLSGEQKDLLAIHDLYFADQEVSDREIGFVKAYRNSLISKHKHTKIIASKQQEIKTERLRKKAMAMIENLSVLAHCFNVISDVIAEDAQLTYALLDKLQRVLDSEVNAVKKTHILDVINLLNGFGLSRPVPKIVVNHNQEYQELLGLLKHQLSHDTISSLKPLTTNQKLLQDLNRIAVPPPPKPLSSELAPVYENPDLTVVVKRKTKLDYDNL